MNPTKGESKMKTKTKTNIVRKSSTQTQKNRINAVIQDMNDTFNKNQKHLPSRFKRVLVNAIVDLEHYE